MICQLLPAGFAHAFQTGTNSTSCFSNLFVGRSGNTLLKIQQARINKSGMGMRIYESGDDDLARAINLHYLLTILAYPGIG